MDLSFVQRHNRGLTNEVLIDYFIKFNHFNFEVFNFK
jgi:hypothetical protein